MSNLKGTDDKDDLLLCTQDYEMLMKMNREDASEFFSYVIDHTHKLLVQEITQLKANPSKWEAVGHAAVALLDQFQLLPPESELNEFEWEDLDERERKDQWVKDLLRGLGVSYENIGTESIVVDSPEKLSDFITSSKKDEERK